MARFYRVATVIVVAVVAVVNAVAAPQETGVIVLPTCARDCMSTFFGSTDCGAADLKCQCESADILGAAYCCIVKNCSAADRRTSNNYMGQLCSAVGVEMPEVKCGLVESDDATGSGTGGASRTSTAGSTESAGTTRSASGITTSTPSGDGSSSTGGIIIPSDDTSNRGDTNNNGGGGGSNALPIGLGVGLGVGIPLTLGVLGYLAFLFWKTKKGIANGGNSGQDREKLNGNLDQVVVAVPREKPELPADPVRPRHELEGDRRFPGELPG